MKIITIQYTLDQNGEVVRVKPQEKQNLFDLRSITMAMPAWFAEVLRQAEIEIKDEPANGCASE